MTEVFGQIDNGTMVMDEGIAESLGELLDFTLTEMLSKTEDTEGVTESDTSVEDGRKLKESVEEVTEKILETMVVGQPPFEIKGESMKVHAEVVNAKTLQNLEL